MIVDYTYTIPRANISVIISPLLFITICMFKRQVHIHIHIFFLSPGKLSKALAAFTFEWMSVGFVPSLLLKKRHAISGNMYVSMLDALIFTLTQRKRQTDRCMPRTVFFLLALLLFLLFVMRQRTNSLQHTHVCVLFSWKYFYENIIDMIYETNTQLTFILL